MRRTPTASESRPALKPLTAAVAAALGSTMMMNAVRAQVRELPMEELVVTASRRDATVQDVPINITAVTGNELESQRIQSLNMFSRQVPGLTVVDQGPRGADLMIVRGLNVNSLNASEFLENGSGETVGTYVGEIPLYVDMKLIDIDRVEVLIGPQGTLYGQGTLGGAVRYIMNKPDSQEFGLEAHGRAYGLAESDSLGYETDFVLNAPIVTDKLAFRGVVSYLDDPGFTDYPYLLREPGVSNPEPDFGNPADVAANLYSVKDADTEQTLSGRLSLGWTPTGSVEVLFGYMFQDQDAGGRSINHRHAFGTGRYESAHRYLEPNDRTNDLFSVEVVADLGFAELTSATGFSHYEENGQRDQTDLLLHLSEDGYYYYEEFPSFSSYVRDTDKEDRLNQEIRLVSAGPGPWNWIVGAFYNDFDQDATSTEHVPGLPDFWGLSLPTGDIEYLQLTKVSQTEQALFGEVGYQFNDRWELTAGARWFDYTTDQTVSFDLPLVDFGGVDVNSGNDNGVLGKLNLAYRPTEDITSYLTVSQGYRIGGVNAVPECQQPLPAGQNVCALPDEVLIDPDTTLNTEIGVHSTLRDGHLILNGALYNIDWEDIQTASTTVNGAIPITVNGGSAVSRGMEASFRINTSGPFAFWGSYAYADAHLTSDAPGLVDGEDAFSGDRLAGSPKNMANFNLNYYRPLNNGWDLDINYGVSYSSDVYTKVGLRNNGEVLPGYTLQNASIGVGKGNWQASIYADNLTNEFVETSVRLDQSYIGPVGNVATFTSRRYFRNVLRPRSVGIEFRYSL